MGDFPGFLSFTDVGRRRWPSCPQEAEDFFLIVQQMFRAFSVAVRSCCDPPVAEAMGLGPRKHQRLFRALLKSEGSFSPFPLHRFYQHSSHLNSRACLVAFVRRTWQLRRII